jgi:hypothetical protein
VVHEEERHGVHLLPVLLVFKTDGDLVSQGEEIGVQYGEDLA